MKVEIVEAWHPDIISKDFVSNLFSGKNKYEAKRYVEKNPCDVRGAPVAFVAGEWVGHKNKTIQGVVLETYLTERWVNKDGKYSLKGRPHQYELSCLVKWAPKLRPKNSLPETEIISATSLKSISTQIKLLESKLKVYTSNSEKLSKYYEEHLREEKYVTTTTEG